MKRGEEGGGMKGVGVGVGVEGERGRLHVSLSMSTYSALDRSDTFRLPYNCSNIAVNVFPFYFTFLSLSPASPASSYSYSFPTFINI